MAGPAAPLYGLYLLAGLVGKAGAKYVVKKYGPNAVGNLLSRHGTKDLATKAKNKFLNMLSRSRDTGPPGKPGVTFGGGTKRSAVIGRERVKKYTLRRRGEGFVAGIPVGVAAGAGAIKGVDYLIDKIKKAKKEDAPTGSLKKQFINAVKDKTDDPKKIAQARTDFDNFVTGKKPSLKFNYGGMVRKKSGRKNK